MNIQITSRHFKAKDSLKTYIHDELGSLSKVNEDITDAEVILSFEKERDSTKIAEIIIKVPGKVITAKEQSDDFGKSVAFAIQKLERQLEKLKNKKMEFPRIDKTIAYEV